MLRCDGEHNRSLKQSLVDADLCIIGGGLAGVCCAVTAARAGLRVSLISDRPVLGGNASSEIRLWVLGATSHMGNNNRWAREGGVIDEILVENTYRNPEGNPLIFDTVVLEKVVSEPNIQLFLNTAVYEVMKESADEITGVRGFCSQNSTAYDFKAPLFCDASGDGVVGFLAGAAFRMGAETPQEFGEKFAPENEYGSLLGHSLFFYTKDIHRKVRFVPPSFALQDISTIPRYRKFNTIEQGCQLWWIEYGGRLDTVHDTEQIKWELWSIVYGVWNHIKNSGEFPEADTLTLEWVGKIPGKRESRRFEGDYLLKQQDLVEQRDFADTVSYGGWAIDLHPADGVYSELAGCNQWHTKGIYPIPYRTMYSRNIANLFIAGRLTSVSHVAFGSTRVMATCAHNAQVIATAAVICSERGLLPKQLTDAAEMEELQCRLQRAGQFIPNVVRADRKDLVQSASISASSQLMLQELMPAGDPRRLSKSVAMLLPLRRGRVPCFSFLVEADTATELVCELRACSSPGSFTPEKVLARKAIAVESHTSVRAVTPHSRLRPLAVSNVRQVDEKWLSDEGNGVGLEGSNGTDKTGARQIECNFDVELKEDQYVFVCLLENQLVTLHYSDQLITGLLATCHATDHRVADKNVQIAPPEIGMDSFEFWCPQRRPHNRCLAMQIEPPLDAFPPANVANGVARPTTGANAWVAEWNDPSPRLTLAWPEPQTIGRVELSFDTDFDHPMESVLMGHPEHVMPYCVRRFRVLDEQGKILAFCEDNYQTRRQIEFSPALITRKLHIEIESPDENIPAALFEVRCYAE